MADSTEELEPLFDYSRVQPLNFVCLDDDDDANASPAFSSKRRKISEPIVVEDVEENPKVIQIVDCDEKKELDWLTPPPKVSTDIQKMIQEDPTIMNLRLKKQELVLFAQSAEDVLRAMEESAKRELGNSIQSTMETVADQPSKPFGERVKIVISIQDKNGLKQFRMYMDDCFERLFKMYADKVKLDIQSLVFCFDGDKISPTATPDGLGMEDNDIIEVHVKPS
ncbi:uncharacterized protein LOC122308932 [Carya illinoinensis]|uniref:Rad60/SUMO-like domain-containing protein n=1 Tax=Carya illinoinensis TaxID=32201 RepID=A0A8T1QNI2_CARIL|nr:uncharacterized protein LOC122308932 [Carya illinoinensis]KAG6655821.1 hypothetical protein CIPAW_05G243600 [Carya illinoinensis]